MRRLLIAITLVALLVLCITSLLFCSITTSTTAYTLQQTLEVRLNTVATQVAIEEARNADLAEVQELLDEARSIGMESLRQFLLMFLTIGLTMLFSVFILLTVRTIILRFNRRRRENTNITYPVSPPAYDTSNESRRSARRYGELARQAAAAGSGGGGKTVAAAGALRSSTEIIPFRQSHPVPHKTDFTLYSPRQVEKQKRYSILVYAHQSEELAAVQHDVTRFSDELGDQPKERHAPHPVVLPAKTPITITPEAEGITFDPPEMTKIWDGKWLRFHFDFEVPVTYTDEEIWLRISVQAKGYVIASIRSSSEVVLTVETPASTPMSAKLAHSVGTAISLYPTKAVPYRNIFLSYAHKDEKIAWRSATEIEAMLGDHVFMDFKDIRPGEAWAARLESAIDEADIIQLLWSENSAASDYCRKEWTYALEKKCPDHLCIGVIRPVYWKKPMPEPPSELKHLQFKYAPLEDE